MWQPVRECYVCGSKNVELDEPNEVGICRDCGHSWGGAMYWVEHTDA